MLRRTSLLVLLLLVTGSARAWNSAGHQLVALLAWERMDPDTRAESARLLRAHPRFARDFFGHMPSSIRRAARGVQDRWIFAHAATWPDIVRGDAAYHRGKWHYINEPLFLDEAARDALEAGLDVNLERAWEGRDEEELNGVQALRRALTLLSGAGGGDRERAVLLCWVLHLAGDLHQPLHATALFAPGLLATGDRGGNAIELGERWNLHSHWDAGLGPDEGRYWYEPVSERAAALAADPALRAAARRARIAFDIESWIDESYRLAHEVVYAPEIVEQVDAAVQSGSFREYVELPPGYLSLTRRVARRRAVEAGARLALWLDGALQP